ncbi:Myc-type [Macleaya cordata]|uniref:Myc-type n=1 Tax=Macleaya cordata TaxID=56857 RepID=A0A200QMH3_MACCD|nr:Myc-type [Macleaya cordata]
MEDLYFMENETCSQGSSSRRRQNINKTTQFKSKNLETERRRRDKINDRLMALRALVPIITNMKKATIMTDAIEYIKELQKEVKGLTDSLREMEAEFAVEEEKLGMSQADTKKCRIEAEVKVIQADENKLWIRVLCEKNRGGFTKLIEALNYLGFQVIDTNFICSKGVTSIMFYVKVIGVEDLNIYLCKMEFVLGYPD